MATVSMQKPINTVYGFLQQEKRVVVWLQHDTALRFEGRLIGYDEFMNVVLADAVEHNKKSGKSTDIGRVLIKGDNVGLLHSV